MGTHAKEGFLVRCKRPELVRFNGGKAIENRPGKVKREVLPGGHVPETREASNTSTDTGGKGSVTVRKCPYPGLYVQRSRQR